MFPRNSKPSASIVLQTVVLLCELDFFENVCPRTYSFHPQLGVDHFVSLARLDPHSHFRITNLLHRGKRPVTLARLIRSSFPFHPSYLIPPSLAAVNLRPCTAAIALFFLSSSVCHAICDRLITLHTRYSAAVHLSLGYCNLIFRPRAVFPVDRDGETPERDFIVFFQEPRVVVDSPIRPPLKRQPLAKGGQAVIQASRRTN